MARLGALLICFSFVGILAGTTVSSAGDEGPPCKRAKFETKLVKDACASGGQKAAKTAMKTFLKEAKKKAPDTDCKSCHKKLAPDNPLKPDSVKRFRELGGK